EMKLGVKIVGSEGLHDLLADGLDVTNFIERDSHAKGPEAECLCFHLCIVCIRRGIIAESGGENTLQSDSEISLNAADDFLNLDRKRNVMNKVDKYPDGTECENDSQDDRDMRNKAVFLYTTDVLQDQQAINKGSEKSSQSDLAGNVFYKIPEKAG